MKLRVYLFTELRCEMLRQGKSQGDLANILHVSGAAVSYRFSGRTPWSLDEVYTILKWLKIDISDISKYFPYKDVISAVNGNI